jgi:glycine cleavage system H protein
VKLNPFKLVPLPNWDITYDGLSKLELFKKFFRTFTVKHSYRSTFSIGGYQTNLLYEPGGNVLDAGNNFIPEKQISSVTVSEVMRPFINFDATLQNSLLAKFEYNRDRNLSLSLTNNQVTEVRGKEYVIGTGYRFKKVKFPFEIGGKTAQERPQPAGGPELAAEQHGDPQDPGRAEPGDRRPGHHLHQDQRGLRDRPAAERARLLRAGDQQAGDQHLLPEHQHEHRDQPSLYFDPIRTAPPGAGRPTTPTTMSTPAELKYTKDHEWVRVEGGEAVIGITHHAQSELGDIVYIDIPTEGQEVERHAVFGTVEAVKTVSDLFMPLSGTVAAVNPGLADDPAAVNKDPYGEGWIIRVKVKDATELADLLTAEQYQATIA